MDYESAATETFEMQRLVNIWKRNYDEELSLRTKYYQQSNRYKHIIKKLQHTISYYKKYKDSNKNIQKNTITIQSWWRRIQDRKKILLIKSQKYWVSHKDQKIINKLNSIEKEFKSTLQSMGKSLSDTNSKQLGELLKLYGQTKKIRGEKYNEQNNRLKDIQEFRDAWSYEENFCNYWTIHKLRKLRKERLSFIQRNMICGVSHNYCWQLKLLNIVGDKYTEQTKYPLLIDTPSKHKVARNLNNIFQMFAHNP